MNDMTSSPGKSSPAPRYPADGSGSLSRVRHLIRRGACGARSARCARAWRRANVPADGARSARCAAARPASAGARRVCASSASARTGAHQRWRGWRSADSLDLSRRIRCPIWTKPDMRFRHVLRVRLQNRFRRRPRLRSGPGDLLCHALCRCYRYGRPITLATRLTGSAARTAAIGTRPSSPTLKAPHTNRG